MAEYEALTHTFDPVYNADSKILILGTFPSVKSRQQHFYYGHPQNRFWKVLAAVTGEQLPVSIEEKKDLLFRNHIAVWDVIHSCSIIGSSDSSIKDVVPNDIAGLLKKTKIRIIAGNGNKACELYQKYCQMQTGCGIMRLPSTSPANAAWNFDRLCDSYRHLFVQNMMSESKVRALMPADCSVLCTPTILPNIRISRD